MANRQTIVHCSLVFFLAISSSGEVIDNMPPSIYGQPRKEVYFAPGSSIHLPCQAIGHPNPSYMWYKNNIEIDLTSSDGRISLGTNGSLVVTNAQRSDDGVYQCRALNSFGESLSINAILREAFIDAFEPAPVQYHYPQVGSSLALRCFPPRSAPMAEIRWFVLEADMRFFSLDMSDNRITMDYSGHLYFTNVQWEDEMDGKSYVCMAMNYFLRRFKRGNEHKIQPQGFTKIPSPPDYLWSSPDDTLGLSKETLKMKCIFSGNPTPVTDWSLPENANTSRIYISSGGQEIRIFDTTEAEGGRYTCTGSSTVNGIPFSVSRSFDVRIESKPYFIIEPQDVVTVSGQSRSFMCKAGGRPAPNIQWYINGVKLQDAEHPTILSERFFRSDENNITFVDLRREDTMCIQCNASNKYGYVFADVFLNVIDSPVTLN